MNVPAVWKRRICREATLLIREHEGIRRYEKRAGKKPARKNADEEYSARLREQRYQCGSKINGAYITGATCKCKSRKFIRPRNLNT